MNATDNPLLALTAEDLMSRDIEIIPDFVSLREAAVQLARREVHGAPVVDATGRCVGVLSVTDVARWVSRRNEPPARGPHSCSHQKKHREPNGVEMVLCELTDGVCPFQRFRERSDGRLVLACTEPRTVVADWQVVEMEAVPSDTVRDVMTATVLTAEPTTPVPGLARLMLEHRIQRLLILDDGQRPVGIVSVEDLLQVLAHPELAGPKDPK